MLCFSLAFTISAVVKTRDGSNCPFLVPLSVTLDALCNLVAEKLRCYPNFLQLRYHLDTDKQTVISIESEDQFMIFMDHMRSLIVPPKLKNGQNSTRIPKPVTIIFEDGSDCDNNGSSSGRTSNTGGKRVYSIAFSMHIILILFMQKGSSTAAQSMIDDQAPKILMFRKAKETQKTTVAELHKCWTCSIHSKDKDILCWQSDDGLCYELTFQHLGFWAIEIVSHRFISN